MASEEGVTGDVLGNILKNELVVLILQVGEYIIVYPLQVFLIQPNILSKASPYQLSERYKVVSEVLAKGYIIEAEDLSAFESFNSDINVTISLDRDLLLAGLEKVVIQHRTEFKEA